MQEIGFQPATAAECPPLRTRVTLISGYLWTEFFCGLDARRSPEVDTANPYDQRTKPSSWMVINPEFGRERGSRRSVMGMYGPPRDCKGKSRGQKTRLRKCIRPLMEISSPIGKRNVIDYSGARIAGNRSCGGSATRERVQKNGGDMDQVQASPVRVRRCWISYFLPSNSRPIPCAEGSLQGLSGSPVPYRINPLPQPVRLSRR